MFFNDHESNYNILLLSQIPSVEVNRIGTLTSESILRLQKQPEVFFEKTFSQKFHKIHRKTLLCFPANFRKFLRTPFFTKYLSTAVSYITIAFVKEIFTSKSNVRVRHFDIIKGHTQRSNLRAW